MNKIPLIGLDLDIYNTKLDNGLDVYIVPFKNTNNVFVTFTTNYGSIQTEFIPNGQNKMIKVPDGIAHFLEHKAFEQEDGTDPFTFFSERGADANASTTNNKTTYLFSGTEFTNENLNYLLDYVQSPYFTDENVEKEKGIISQEIKMYQDNPFSRLREQSFYNLFINSPYKYSVAGTIETINKITKENLYDCYNTFYNPANMFLVITGNVKEDIIDVIKKNQSKKTFDKQKDIMIKEYNEPEKVAVPYEKIELNNITIPKVAINYKISAKKFESVIKALNYLKIILNVKIGPSSDLCQKLKEEELINDNIYSFCELTDDFIIASINFESNDYETVIERIENELKELTIDDNDLERRKKVIISSLIYGSDSIYTVNTKIINNIIEYGKVINDSVGLIKSLNIKEMNNIIKQISLKNKAICVIKNK